MVVIGVVAAGYECRPEGRRNEEKKSNVVDGGGDQRKTEGRNCSQMLRYHTERFSRQDARGDDGYRQDSTRRITEVGWSRSPVDRWPASRCIRCFCIRAPMA